MNTTVTIFKEFYTGKFDETDRTIKIKEFKNINIITMRFVEKSCLLNNI